MKHSIISVVVALLLFGGTVACTSSVERPTDPTATETAAASTTPPVRTSTPTPTPTFVAVSTSTPIPTRTPKPNPPTQVPIDRSVSEIPVDLPGGIRSIAVGEPIPFAPEWTVLATMGCWGCDGPSAFTRLTWSEEGVVYESILTTLPRGGRAVNFLGVTQTVDGASLIAAICSDGLCGGFDFMADEPETTLFRSDDGGWSWYETSQFARSYRVVAADSQTVLVWEGFTPPPDGNRYLLLPSAEVVEAPADAGGPSFGPGGLIWRLRDGTFLGAAGMPALGGLQIGFADLTGYPVLSSAPRWSIDGGMMVHWTEDRGRSRERYLTIIEPGGAEVTFYLGHWLSDQYLEFVPFGWLDADRLIGRVSDTGDGSFGIPTLAVFDIDSGVVFPVLVNNEWVAVRSVVAAFVDLEPPSTTD